MELGYSSSDMEGVLRPTITEGTIAVRNDPGADLSGLNRNLDGAREVTKDENSSVDIYVSKALLDKIINGTPMLSEHDEAAEKTGVMPNLFIGLFINQSVAGPAHFVQDRNGNYVFDEETEKPKTTGKSEFASDQNPFLQALYHLVPGIKSFSEIHDIQVDDYVNDYGEKYVDKELYIPLTIPGSFAKSYTQALIGLLDVTNWAKNWNTYIKPSYKDRTVANDQARKQ